MNAYALDEPQIKRIEELIRGKLQEDIIGTVGRGP